MPSFKCANCKLEKAKVYVVESKKTYCKFCCALLHHPTTNNEKFSIEEIDNIQGVKILTPILLDLLLLYGVVFLLSGSGIDQSYFTGASYCPGLTRGRWTLMKYDANLFFYMKSHLATYCDLEDSYWRFFMDTWVRGIITETDTWLLIVSELVRAFLFEEFIRIIVSPIIAWCYSAVATVVGIVELKLAQFIYAEEGEEHYLTDTLKQIEKAVDNLSLAHKLELDSTLKVTPQTLPRKRPYKDWIEHIQYRTDRYTRQSMYYRAVAQSACTFILRGTLMAAVALRLFCMVFGGSPFVLAAKLIGSGDLVQQHADWFTEATGTVPKTRDGYFSDWAVYILISQAFGKANLFSGAAKGLGGGVVGGSRAVLFPLLLRAGVVLAVLLAGPALFWWKITKQRADFDAMWKKKYKKECWGDMSRDTPCAGWKENWYSSISKDY